MPNQMKEIKNGWQIISFSSWDLLAAFLDK